MNDDFFIIKKESKYIFCGTILIVYIFYYKYLLAYIFDNTSFSRLKLVLHMKSPVIILRKKKKKNKYCQSRAYFLHVSQLAWANSFYAI